MTAAANPVPALRESALAYAAQGWACHPLRLNDEGLPKVATVPEWQSILPPDVDQLPWDIAAGIGIIGGNNSGNLAFIDIDDQELAADTVAWLVRKHRNPLFAWTARARAHIYVIEPTPSRTRRLNQNYKGRPVLVEHRSAGAYVAARPSP